MSGSAWLADNALQLDWAACPALVWEGVSNPSLLGQGADWGEGKQSWHRTTPRCSISLSSLHCAELLLRKSVSHSLTHCQGSSQLEIPYPGGRRLILLLPVVYTEASQFIRLVCSQVFFSVCPPHFVAMFHVIAANPGRIWRRNKWSSRGVSAAGTALNC